MKGDLHSLADEPNFQDRKYNGDPFEARVNISPQVPQIEIEAARDSVFSEPHVVTTGTTNDFADFVRERRESYSPASALGWAVLAGILTGPFASIGAQFGENPGLTGMFYVIVAGPIIEEILKQSGLVYLLEKKPYLLSRTWQFPLCAAISALVFAAIENVVYINVYFGSAPDAVRTSLAAFRWITCTALHVGCSMIASIGMGRVWRDTILTGKPANLSAAANYVGVAALIHGCYNLVAVLLDRTLF